MKPLQNIRNIEESIHKLKTKIELINKQEQYNLNRIDQIFNRTISLVKDKITLHEVPMSKHPSAHSIHYRPAQPNKIKELALAIKVGQSKCNKEQTLKYRDIISTAKKQNFKRKKQQAMLVKWQLQKSKDNINHFHSFKIQDLKKVRLQQQREVTEEVSKKQKQCKRLTQKCSTHANNGEEAKMVLRQLKFAIRKVEKMKPENFKKLRQEVIYKENEQEPIFVERLLNAALSSHN